MHRLLLLGLDHDTAPLALRERLAFDAAGSRAMMDAFAAQFPEAELVPLSTCNRVELYTAQAQQGQPRSDDLIGFLASYHHVDIEHLKPHIYQRQDRAVVEHLFRVCSSLESMVLGETQILGQVRSAYELSRQRGSTRTILHPLFQRAMAVGKQVLTQTDIAEGRLSIASIAVDYARRIFERFDDKTVLSVGAGKMGVLVLKHLADLKPRTLVVCSRDLAKAQRVAGEFDGQAIGMDQLATSLVSADVVVCSTASVAPIITRTAFEPIVRKRRSRPIFLIDIALPRDIEPEIGQLNGVYLYNLDDLQLVVEGTRDSRRDAVRDSENLIAGAVEEYTQWHRAHELGPVIEELYQRYHRLALEEVKKAIEKVPHPTPIKRQRLEQLARRIVNKLLHNHVRELRNAQRLHGPPAQYLHTMEEQFDLGQEWRDERDKELK
ncbi:MAG: glutamyl-tRNA reductase [Phycisphaerales bacterium]|nr:glutamyl-tRNA reductase [Phycisphaerales bacterium]